ncbi:unnamed protein product [Mycena citricolor]|uniref:Uncharacterized protein n=1 Tax=Mycena citricolor TaxID=2018698 RepID=A0AAD2JU62_9AGAR|nr:unnamed protein product [Mycena citricolor]
MTPEETATLRSIGLDLIKSFVAIVNESILLTIYGVLVLKACSVLLRKEWRRTPTLLTIIALLTMFAVCVVLWALDMANFIMEVKLSMVIDLDLALDARFHNALAFILKLAAAQDALYSYLSLIGDAIIIWRLWNLRTYFPRWVIVLPLASLLGSTVVTVLLTYCVGAVGSEIVLGTFQNPELCRNVQISTYAMACATTTLATGLIGATAWSYASGLKSMTSDPGKSSWQTGSGRNRRVRSQGESILVLMIESGLFYFLFFAIQLVGDVPRVHRFVTANNVLSFLFTMFSYATSVIVGIYPTIVVVLAQTKAGVLDSAPSASAPISSLRIGGLPSVAPTSESAGVASTQPTYHIASKDFDGDQFPLEQRAQAASNDLHSEGKVDL